MPVRGTWVQKKLSPREKSSLEDFVQFCRRESLDIVILPLAWFDNPAMRRETVQAVMADPRFKVTRVFDYAGRPGVVVARFRGPL
jgi:hypothetical protein